MPPKLPTGSLWHSSSQCNAVTRSQRLRRSFITTIARPSPRPGRGRLQSPFCCNLPGTLATKRGLFDGVLPAILTPPLVLLGCTVGMYVYKCCMLVIFQNKIIYMPSLPPFSRSEKIADYEETCKPVKWEEMRIRSLDGTGISLCVGQLPAPAGIADSLPPDQRKHVVVMYFQGHAPRLRDAFHAGANILSRNGASLPPRLPTLSRILKSLHDPTDPSSLLIDYTLVALSYRGYWTSRGRASQRGIELDARAALTWCRETYLHPDSPASDLRLVLWGQSLGAGVASWLAAEDFMGSPGSKPQIRGLVLETPFVSIRKMLAALYPQKWLPYKHLWPFLRNHWDTEAALRSIGTTSAAKQLPILLLSARRDEVVPTSQADELEEVCRSVGLRFERKDVLGALHTEATARDQGRMAVAGFIRAVSEEKA